MNREASQRLKRAIQLGSLSIVKRILASNPHNTVLLQNVDEEGNTSLHLAAQLGLVDIASHLLLLGHETPGISRNTSGATPLHLACQSPDSSPTNLGCVAVARLIIKSSAPINVLIKDKDGLDALAHAAKCGNSAVVQLLLSLPREPFISLLEDGDTGLPNSHNDDHSNIDGRRQTHNEEPNRTDGTHTPPPIKANAHPLLHTRDLLGNTPLHHASAWGHLKAVRLLIDAGLSATARNAAGWTPIEYSATVAAEVYLRNLMKEKMGTGIRADGRGLGAVGRKVSAGAGASAIGGGFGIGSGSGVGVKGGMRVRLVESDRSEDEEERRASGDDELGRSRTFT